MNRVFIIGVLSLLAPLAQAHTEKSSTGIYETKPDGPAIAFQVYKSDQGTENGIQFLTMPAGFGSGIIKPVIIWVTSKAIESVVNNAKEVTCPAVNNGDVTVSLTLNADVTALVFGAGATGGLAVTFECVGGDAV